MSSTSLLPDVEIEEQPAAETPAETTPAEVTVPNDPPRTSASQLAEAMQAAWETGLAFPPALCLSVPMDAFQVALCRCAGHVGFDVLMLDKLSAVTRLLPPPIQRLAAITLLSQFGITDDLAVSPGALVFTIWPSRDAESPASRIVPAKALTYGCLRYYLAQERIQLRWTLGYAGEEGGQIRIGNGKRIGRMFDLSLPPGLTSDRFLVDAEEAHAVTPNHPNVVRRNQLRQGLGIDPELYPRAGLQHLDLEDASLCDHAIQALTALRAHSLFNQCAAKLARLAGMFNKDVSTLMQHPDTVLSRDPDEARRLSDEIRALLHARIQAARMYLPGDLSLPRHYLRYVQQHTPPLIADHVHVDPVHPDFVLLESRQLQALTAADGADTADSDRMTSNRAMLLCQLASSIVVDLQPLDAAIGRWHFRGQSVQALPRQDACWDVLPAHVPDRGAGPEPEAVSVEDFASARRYYLPQVIDRGRRMLRHDFVISAGGLYFDLGDWLSRARA
jgi:hypothetical protein